MIINQNKKLSVVIVSYNVCDFVEDAINSLYQYCNIELQIILVDNNSIDNTVTNIKNKFNDVLIIQNKTNVGFSAANNQGFNLCSGNLVLMLNPDALLIDYSINELLDYMFKSDDRLIVGPQLLNTNGSVQTSSWKFPTPWQHFLELFFINSIFKKNNYCPKNITQVDSLSGACLLIKIEHLKDLNGLDENLFWMDDVDFCKRNLSLKGKNLLFPTTKIKHHIGESSKKNQKIVISNQIISKLKFYKKNQQFIYFYLSLPIFYLQIISRILLFLFMSLIKPYYFIKFKAYLFTFSKLSKYVFKGNQNIL